MVQVGAKARTGPEQGCCVLLHQQGLSLLLAKAVCPSCILTPLDSILLQQQLHSCVLPDLPPSPLPHLPTSPLLPAGTSPHPGEPPGFLGGSLLPGRCRGRAVHSPRGAHTTHGPSAATVRTAPSCSLEGRGVHESPSAWRLGTAGLMEEGLVGRPQAFHPILAWPKRARHSLPHFAASGAIHTITFC